ncbi:MAG TPA: cold shock domain-containing protein, partial [Stellaceae bacterium]|nr:cold shock domain-containing protein [Stellaceae bacterium]
MVSLLVRRLFRWRESSRGYEHRCSGYATQIGLPIADIGRAIIRRVCRINRQGQVVQHQKGYGFIARDSGAADVFVHISALERSGLTGLSEGDRVIVDIAEG